MLMLIIKIKNFEEKIHEIEYKCSSQEKIGTIMRFSRGKTITFEDFFKL